MPHFVTHRIRRFPALVKSCAFLVGFVVKRFFRGAGAIFDQ
jgi:hypothetical protein